MSSNHQLGMSIKYKIHLRVLLGSKHKINIGRKLGKSCFIGFRIE